MLEKPPLRESNEGSQAQSNAAENVLNDNVQGQEELESAAGWLLVKKIKRGELEAAKQMLSSEKIILDEEQKKTLSWVKIRAMKDNNSEVIDFIDQLDNL